MSNTIPTVENLAKAKAVLVLDHPFFASLFLGMPLISDPSVKTLCTNGDEIRYNPEFMANMPVKEILFCLAHETMHCVFQHMHTRGARDPNKWNIAGDYIINQILTDDKVGTMPHGCLLNPDLVKQGDGTTHGVYALLPDDPKGNPGAGETGGALDQVQDAAAPGDTATNSQKQADMRVKIVQAANAAKMAGKLSAGMARVVKELTATRVNWKDVLRRFFSERAKIDLSYAKPKKRFMADDLMLPGLVGDRMGAVVIAVDGSGSITEAILSEFAVEMKAIKQDVDPSALHVIYFDSEVCHVATFGPDQDLVIEAHGGGGTAFSPIFKYIDSENLEPVACVVLTDLECSDFGPAPAYPVLWASIADGPAPFGEVLIMKGIGTNG